VRRLYRLGLSHRAACGEFLPLSLQHRVPTAEQAAMDGRENVATTDQPFERHPLTAPHTRR
jgi:hypothetical protein